MGAPGAVGLVKFIDVLVKVLVEKLVQPLRLVERWRTYRTLGWPWSWRTNCPPEKADGTTAKAGGEGASVRSVSDRAGKFEVKVVPAPVNVVVEMSWA